jgi:hypothetical protein
METKTRRVPASPAGAAKPHQQPQQALVSDTPEIDYAPRKMTPRETLVVSLKLALVTAVVFGLLWLAHVKLEK